MNENNIKKAPYLVVELLESFSEKELKGLQKIISCAYFNTDRYVIKLLDVLIKKVLHQTDINPIIQYRLYNQVFSDLPPAKTELKQKQKAILRSKISTLTRLAERFITIEALEKSNQHQYDLKLNALLDKKQYRLFNKHLKKAEILAEESQEKNNMYEFQYQIEQCRFRAFYETGYWIKVDNINKLVELSNLNYLTKRMDWAINALQFQERKPKSDYDLSIVQLKDHKLFINYFNDKYSYLVFQMASIELSMYETETTFHNYLEILEKIEALISRDELKAYYKLASNFCIKMSRKGKVEYSNHLAKIQQKLDRKKLLLVGDKIPIVVLKNIINCGCKVGKYDWVLYMIEKYTPYIEKRYRTDLGNFNIGYLAFQRKNYQEAIDHLLEVNNFQKSYDIDKRMLILKSYYELEKHYNEPTAQLFRSIEAFVLNSKLYTDIDKNMYKFTIRIFYNLYRYKHSVGKMTLDKLQQQVEEAEYIASKAWLLEKIEELRGK